MNEVCIAIIPSYNNLRSVAPNGDERWHEVLQTRQISSSPPKANHWTGYALTACTFVGSGFIPEAENMWPR